MTMSRWIVPAVIVSLVSPSVALAGDSLLSSAIKIAQEAARKDSSVLTVALPRVAAQSPPQQGTALLTTPERSRRTKVMIGLGMAAALAGSFYAIVSKSENITPSSQGTREDGCSCW